MKVILPGHVDPTGHSRSFQFGGLPVAELSDETITRFRLREQLRELGKEIAADERESYRRRNPGAPSAVVGIEITGLTFRRIVSNEPGATVDRSEPESPNVTEGKP